MTWLIGLALALFVIGLLALCAAVRSSQNSEALRRSKDKGPGRAIGLTD